MTHDIHINTETARCPAGFEAAGAACGLRRSGKPDLALFLCRDGASADRGLEKLGVYEAALAPILAIRMVSGIDEALAHVARHGSGHTECIVTEDGAAAARFLDRVDAAIVMHNTSTQFADGGEFGMGAEIGIATGKLHARGPVGTEQLTSYKYLVRSDGATRA